MKYTKADFGKLSDGTTVYKYTLENDKGMSVDIITYGATVTSIKFDSREMTLGFDTLEEWENNNIFAGATVGRFANRIADGKFTIDGETYELSKNEDPKTLHGGIKGFDKVVWGVQVMENEESISIMMFRICPDGEQGFPGNLDAYVTYTLNNENELQIDYTATTDKSTHVNFSHHSYFNLSDEPTVENHQVMINADKFTPLMENSIPDGKILPVENSSMDLREMTTLKNAFVKNDGGYDDNFVLNKDNGDFDSVAKVYAPDTGIEMEVLTSKPGIQFYTGNYIDNLKGRNGDVYQQYAGLCLEPQYFPDAPNQPEFTSSLLTPDEEYFHRIIYRFSKK